MLRKIILNGTKLFLGLGIITVISGSALIADNQYLIGISGCVVGGWLIQQNLKKLKDQKEG